MPGDLVLELPNDLRAIERAVDYLTARAREAGFDDALIRLNFRVGVTEALANAMLYGNRGDEAKQVVVKARFTPQLLRVEVRDEGGGFDPDGVVDPTLPENRLRAGGRGIFLIRKLMHQVEFNEAGNAITMTLRTDAPPAPPEQPAESSEPLPRDVLDLLKLRRGAGAVRLLARAESGWREVYPAECVAENAPPPGAARRDVGDEPYAVEVGGENPEGDAEFLAMALAQAFLHEREAHSAARELTERYEEINLLYFISEILGSVLSVPDAASRILVEVCDVLGARRASLWVYRTAEQVLDLAAAVGEEGLRGPISVDDPESATAWVFRQREHLNLERDTVLEGLPRLEPRPQGREAFLSVPINYTPPEGDARTVGVITLVGRRSNVRFSAGDARLLSAIASQVGAALETQRLIQESLRQERLVRELELAHDLQLKLLPDPRTFHPPPEVAARCVPAESVGGDFYQLFRLPGDRLGIMIGDVSSHGFSAALIMALTMSALGIYAQESGPPGEVLRRVHEALEDELRSTEMYMTLFYGVLDAAEGRMIYANAGHPHVFRIDREGGSERLGATDPPMGMLPLAPYGEAAAPWEAGDVLCLFTDGLSDALAEPGVAQSGEVALVERVSQRGGRPLEEMLDALFDDAAAAQSHVPADDRTALLVRR